MPHKIPAGEQRGAPAAIQHLEGQISVSLGVRLLSETVEHHKYIYSSCQNESNTKSYTKINTEDRK